MVNLAKAPLVIKQKKVTNVNLLGTQVGQKQTLTADMTTQGLSDVQYWLRTLPVEETDAQLKVNNEPTRLVVDNREGKALRLARRRVEVTYGEFLDQLMIRTIERNVMEAVRHSIYALVKTFRNREVLPGVPYDELLQVTDQGNWQWVFAQSYKENARPVNPYRLGSLSYGSLLIYKPKSRISGLANMLAARQDAGLPLFMKGRSGGHGFMSTGINRLKRARLFRNYIISIVFTQRFKNPNEIYKHGTPVVVVRVRRKKRGYKKRLS